MLTQKNTTLGWVLIGILAVAVFTYVWRKEDREREQKFALEMEQIRERTDLSAPVRSGEWFEGGQLQNATGQEWTKAAEESRLATAAFFLVAGIGENEVQQLGGIEKLRPAAVELMYCIDTTFQGPEGATLRTMKVAPIAAACLVMIQ